MTKGVYMPKKNKNKNKDKDKVSVYINPDEFLEAAKYVNKNLLSKPYTGFDEKSKKNYNQRAILLLENGKMITKFGPDTLDPTTGEINIKAIEKRENSLVTKIMQRPNHGLLHSMRAAAAIPVINQYYKKCTNSNTDLSLDQQARLQRMMLFSVVGRKDETGWGDSKQNDDKRYQSFRATSGLEYIKYYENSALYQNRIEDLYQDALIVELMGFPNPPPLLDPDGNAEYEVVKLMLQKNIQLPSTNTSTIEIPEQPTFFEGWYNWFTVSKEEQARKDREEQARIQKGLDEERRHNEYPLFLSMMNDAHDAELLRCYPYESTKKVKHGEKPAENISKFTGRFMECVEQLDSLEDINEDTYKNALGFILYQAKLQEKSGEKTATKLQTNEQAINDIIATCLDADKIDYDLYFKEALVNDEILQILFEQTLGDSRYVNNINLWHLRTPQHISKADLENIKAKNNGQPYTEISNIERYPFELQKREDVIKLIQEYYPYKIGMRFEKAIFSNGSYTFNKKVFNFVQYDKYRDPTTENSDKEVDIVFQELNKVPRPEFFETVGLEKVNKPPVIETLPRARDRIYVNDDVQLIFDNVKEAKKAMQGFMDNKILTSMPKIELTDSGINACVTLSKEDYAKLIGIIRFKMVEIPKHISSESNLIDEEGQINALGLITKKGDGITRVFNTVATNAKALPGDTGYDYNLNGLDNPATAHIIPELKHIAETDRVLYTDPRTGEKLVRPLVEKEDPELQVPLTTNPDASEYYDPETGSAINRPIHLERGGATNTEFSKKASFSLQPKAGNMRSFGGITKDKPKWLPIGFLHDLNEVHLKGERYIFSKNVVSNDRFWLGDIPPKEKYREARKAISIADLKQQLEQPIEGKYRKWNEILVGPSKKSTKALFVPSNFPNGNERGSQLMLRLNVLFHAMRIKGKYGYDLPLMIIDGINEPRLYSEKMIKTDLKQAIALLAKDEFPYLPDREKDLQQDVLKKLFKGIANAKDLRKINDDDLAIDNMLERMDLLGGISREQKYLEQHYNENPPTSQNNCFLRAVVLGHTALIKEMIRNGFDVNIILNEKTGNTALHYAYLNGHIDIANLLIDNDANITVVNKKNESPDDIFNAQLPRIFHNAIISGDVEVITKIIENNTNFINYAFDDGNTPLHLAYLNFQPEIAKVLLSWGADTTINNNLGKTPADINMENQATPQASTGASTGITTAAFTSTIEEKKLKLNFAQAIKGGDVEAVTSMLDAGFPINATIIETNQSTALHFALRINQFEIAKLLITRGADTTIPNKAGLTSEDIMNKNTATMSELIMLAQQIKQPRATELQKNEFRQAINNSDVDKITQILDEGFPINEVLLNKSQSTALHIAILKGMKEIVELLIARGADIHVKNDKGKTPEDLMKLNVRPKAVRLSKAAKVADAADTATVVKDASLDTALHDLTNLQAQATDQKKIKKK